MEKREVKFLDANHNLFTVEVEITQRNGYPELTMSGNYGSSCGQCLDAINPANEHQAKLVELWNKYHLENVSKVKNIKDTLNDVIKNIINAEEFRKGKPLTGFDDSSLIDIVEQFTDFEDEEARLCAALVQMFDLSENDLEHVEINETSVTVQGINYIAGNDEQMDEKTYEYIKDSAWAFNKGFIIDHSSVLDNDEGSEQILSAIQEQCEGGNEAVLKLIDDFEEFADDAISADGRGHFLNNYNGAEEEASINGVYYYACRN